MLRFMSTVACTVACGAFVLAQGEPAGGPVKVTRIVDTPQTRVVQVEIPRPSLNAIRERCRQQLATLPGDVTQLLDGRKYPVRITIFWAAVVITSRTPRARCTTIPKRCGMCS